MAVIRAAGGLLWREDGGTRRIAVIHRPHREDWTLPKGKLKEDEGWEAAALREVAEETGCEARIVSFAGLAHYVPRRTPKVVLYWNMALVREGALDAPGEVDEVAWLTPEEALERLDLESDRDVLEEALHLHTPPEDEDEDEARSHAFPRGALVLLAVACVAALVLAAVVGPTELRWSLLGGAVSGAAVAALASLLHASSRE
jgi:8-oxo-dGTP diphosphatase